jgi:chromate transporter
LNEHDFEDAIATTNLLPGPASTQLAIYCAWRLRGIAGALLGGFCFIVPGLIMILALSEVFLAKNLPIWLLGLAAGAGAAIPAVALNAALRLVPSSRSRIGSERTQRLRWIAYAIVGAIAASVFATLLVFVILACGFLELSLRRDRRSQPPRSFSAVPLAVVPPVALGGAGALTWVALKVGALSFGGGFVIIPLMQHDAVSVYHWMSGAQFLSAVALGQLTPGPVVQTVAVVGYAEGGLIGGLLAAAIAFLPSFAFIIVGAPHFERLRSNVRARAFLIGAGATVIGAIAGSAVPLGLSLHHLWQIPILGCAGLWLILAKKSVVGCLLLAALAGMIVALCGVPS